MLVKPSMIKLRDMIKRISPILITPTTSSITISLSKRFFLFTIMEQVIKRIEDDPYLNFISLLKSYKVLGRILYGTFHEFHRDRNKIYFKNFFVDRSLYNIIKEDLEWLAAKYDDIKDVKMTLTKEGIIIYDNYKKNSFNVLLLTTHSGRWVPEKLEPKIGIPQNIRICEEDIDTNKLYCNLVLEKGGIWIDNKESRFVSDLNRHISRTIYTDKSEEWIDKIWKEKLTESEIKGIHSSYGRFYFTLDRLVEAYRFNIIFDAHSMKDLPGRAAISFGAKYVSKFYMPIVKGMQRKLSSLGYHPVSLNAPYGGGYILKWLNNKFPEIFIFSMEVNKKLYMTKNRRSVVKYKLNKIAKDITKIFDIEIEEAK